MKPHPHLMFEFGFRIFSMEAGGRLRGPKLYQGVSFAKS